MTTAHPTAASSYRHGRRLRETARRLRRDASVTELLDDLRRSHGRLTTADRRHVYGDVATSLIAAAATPGELLRVTEWIVSVAPSINDIDLAYLRKLWTERRAALTAPGARHGS